MNQDVTIVGAGVVGLSIALAAQSRGLCVRVIEREGPAAGASAGNAETSKQASICWRTCSGWKGLTM